MPVGGGSSPRKIPGYREAIREPTTLDADDAANGAAGALSASSEAECVTRAFLAPHTVSKDQYFYVGCHRGWKRNAHRSCRWRQVLYNAKRYNPAEHQLVQIADELLVRFRKCAASNHSSRFRIL